MIHDKKNNAESKEIIFREAELPEVFSALNEGIRLRQLAEVGLPPSATDEELDLRQEVLINGLGMAPSAFEGWKRYHGKAARIATDLNVESLEDVEKLGPDTKELLRAAVQGTYHHHPDLYGSDGAFTLENNRPSFETMLKVSAELDVKLAERSSQNS